MDATHHEMVFVHENLKPLFYLPAFTVAPLCVSFLLYFHVILYSNIGDFETQVIKKSREKSFICTDLIQTHCMSATHLRRNLNVNTKTFRKRVDLVLNRSYVLTCTISMHYLFINLFIFNQCEIHSITFTAITAD